MSVKISKEELLSIHDALVVFNEHLENYEENFFSEAVSNRDWDYVHHVSGKFLIAQDSLDLVRVLLDRNKKESEKIKNGEKNKNKGEVKN